MAAHIDVTIPPLKLPLVGVRGINVLVDGEVATPIDFGKSATVNVEPGMYRVAIQLSGVLNRTSNGVTVELTDGEVAGFIGRYSRLWGSFSLKRTK